MDVSEQVQTFLSEKALSLQEVRYISRLVAVHDELQKHSDLYNITSVADLPDQTTIKLRKLAQCFGITHLHGVNSKEQLISKINTKYAEISQKPGTETTPMEVDTKPTAHEQKIQRPLTIGEPKSYDSEEYFDLRIIRNMYSDYPIEIVEKKHKHILMCDTMETFFCKIIVELFFKHFRCFKCIHSGWYKFAGSEWIPMFENEIDEFVLWFYNRIESVARQIDRDLTLAYTLIDIKSRNNILKRAVVLLKQSIKKCIC